MHLLHVIDSMDPAQGGPSEGIRNLDKNLRGMGVLREVVCLDPPDASFLASHAFKIHALGRSPGAWHYSKDLIPWLVANIPRFDVIIVNGLWQYHSFAVQKSMGILKKRAGIKIPALFVMPHGMLDPYFQKAKERRIKAIRNWIYWKIIENKVVNGADGVLFTCEAELLLARETFAPYSPRNEFNVSYGIEPPPPYTSGMTEAFRMRCTELKEQPYLLFLSRIHKKKGVDLLVNAYLKLADLYPGIPKLVIAGPGLETDFGKQVYELATKTTIGKSNIYFTGMLTGDAKWGAYYGCEAFVLPSHQENFGIAVVEALACAKPVLISDQINIWREIKDGGIIGPDTLDGTIAMLKKWLELSTDERKHMKAKAFEAYHSNFESMPAAQKLYNVLALITKQQIRL